MAICNDAGSAKQLHSVMRILLVHTPFNWKRPLTIISWLIRKVTTSHWNHCALLVELHGQPFIIESDIKGVVMMPFKNWVRQQQIAVFNTLESSHRMTNALKKVGVSGYSFADLFWFMPIYLLTGQFYGRKVDGYSNKPTCYEFAAWVHDFPDWYKIEPKTFINELYRRRYTHEITIQAAEYYEQIKTKGIGKVHL